MADVAAWVAQIRAAIYGEQVRESIAKSIEAMNDDNIETLANYNDTIADVEAATDAATDAAEGAVAIKETVEEKLAHGDFIGATGPQGEAATVAVGTVTTGQPGTAVQVVNSGTNTDAVLDFTIPQGATGNVENMDTVQITFEPDTTDQNIASGMTLSGLFGRLQGLIGSIRTTLSTHQSSITSLNDRFAYKNGISLNDLKTAGLYFCDSVSGTPSGAPWTSWIVEVYRAANAVKQVIYPLTVDTGMYMRRYDGSTWTDWVNACPINHIAADLSTIKYIAKPKGASYGSFFIIGTVGGIGAVALVVTINNSAIASIVNLVTGAAWTNTGFTVTYSVTNGIGYIGVKTTSTSGSNLTIIAG